MEPIDVGDAFDKLPSVPMIVGDGDLKEIARGAYISVETNRKMTAFNEISLEISYRPNRSHVYKFL